MPIKTFRGVLADGEQDTVVLHTNNGSTGYRIVNFQIMSQQPGAAHQESIVQIFKISQTTVPTTAATIDFQDNTLLAAGVLINNSNLYGHKSEVIFENEIFNQDIYVTHTDNESSTACNYYIELEQVKLNLDENTVATLKDIRNLSWVQIK